MSDEKTLPSQGRNLTYTERLLVAASGVDDLVDELLTAIECAEQDVGGCRPTADIIAELGPRSEKLHAVIQQRPPQSTLQTGHVHEPHCPAGSATPRGGALCACALGSPIRDAQSGHSASTSPGGDRG